ncbi:MAG: helix-turn-helix domain-containing protein [Candidatus Sulfotelmatobacter sp.]
MLNAAEEANVERLLVHHKAYAVFQRHHADERRLLNTRQAAVYLNCSQWTVRRMVYRHEIRVIKSTKFWQFDRKDLDRWVEEAKQ